MVNQKNNPSNPSTMGNAGSNPNKPEALANIEPNPQTADNANTGPVNNNNNANNNNNQQNVTNINPQDGTRRTTSGKPPVKSIRFRSKFLEIKITDPNILDRK